MSIFAVPKRKDGQSRFLRWRGNKQKFIESNRKTSSIAEMLWPLWKHKESVNSFERDLNGIKSYRSKQFRYNIYNEEFDPGSGWTLAAGLTHASRGAAGCSNTLPATGARVRNAWATCPLQEDKPWKRGLILHSIFERHLLDIKVSTVTDWLAWH